MVGDPTIVPEQAAAHPRVDDRRVLNGIFWRLRTGAPTGDHKITLNRARAPTPDGHCQTSTTTSLTTEMVLLFGDGSFCSYSYFCFGAFGEVSNRVRLASFSHVLSK